jgi:hypothetical protein
MTPNSRGLCDTYPKGCWRRLPNGPAEISPTGRQALFLFDGENAMDLAL